MATPEHKQSERVEAGRYELRGKLVIPCWPLSDASEAVFLSSRDLIIATNVVD